MMIISTFLNEEMKIGRALILSSRVMEKVVGGVKI